MLDNSHNIDKQLASSRYQWWVALSRQQDTPHTSFSRSSSELFIKSFFCTTSNVRGDANTEILGSGEGKLCWLSSLIIFLIQRSLFSTVFIPHEDFTLRKNVHSSTRGRAEGGYPLCGIQGQVSPHRGFGSEAPKGKIAL
jgi:hypothetical protein